MSEQERKDVLEDMFVSIPDFDTQMQLYNETPASQRTSGMLMQRMQQMIDKDEEKEQRSLQEQSFMQQLGTKERNQSGKHTQLQPDKEAKGR